MHNENLTKWHTMTAAVMKKNTADIVNILYFCNRTCLVRMDDTILYYEYRHM